MTAEDLEVIENEESRQQQGSGLGLLFKGLGFGGNKQQIDPHLMMLVNHLKKRSFQLVRTFVKLVITTYFERVLKVD
jgi:hypothetical protein